ncbi:uncharacterized protein [Apostichopus japonicus]|uniref:uncharacterized protein n=1 Tax=Stichopus japonicus TaxID=307972 RepID=UPI003AB1E668
MATNGIGDPKPKKIFMWINPRSLSTSFEKCVGLMDGIQTWHEPYTTCYFNQLFNDPETFTKFPKMNIFVNQFLKATKLLEAGGHIYDGGNLQPTTNFTRDWVKEQLEKPIQEDKQFMFIKDTAMGVDGYYDKLPNIEAKHTFIIRNPHRVVFSARRLLMHLYEHKGDPDDFNLSGDHPFMAWEKLSPDPLFKLWNYVRENIDPNPIVIDADDLQNYPEETLRKYCEAVGIPFKKKYTNWPKSDESLKYFHGALEQMVWGKNEGVYDAAFLSSCILPLTKPLPDKVPEKCEGYAAEFREGYKIMYETRLKPTE